MKALTKTEPRIKIGTEEIPEWAIKVTELRTRLDESRAVFGRRFGVTRMAVWYWEHGRCEPPAAVLMFAITGKEVQS